MDRLRQQMMFWGLVARDVRFACFRHSLHEGRPPHLRKPVVDQPCSRAPISSGLHRQRRAHLHSPSPRSGIFRAAVIDDHPPVALTSKRRSGATFAAGLFSSAGETLIREFLSPNDRS